MTFNNGVSIESSWIPQSVVLLSDRTPMQNEIRLRLLNDQRMKDVWLYLKRKAVDQPELRQGSFRPRYDLKTWGCETSNISINDQLCGTFFMFTLHSLSINDFTSTRAEMDEHAKRWADAALICREATAQSMLRPIDKDLSEALPRIADHFDVIAELIRGKNNPRILKNKSQNDKVKSHVRTIAQGTKAIFGDYCYGILAKVASVALDIEPMLKEGTVEKWCKDLPPYLPSMVR